MKARVGQREEKEEEGEEREEEEAAVAASRSFSRFVSEEIYRRLAFAR